MHRISPQDHAQSTKSALSSTVLRRVLVFGVAASLSLAAPISAIADPALLPVAHDDLYSVKAGGSITVYIEDLLANDTDGTAVLSTDKTGLMQGTLQSIKGSNNLVERLVYTPAAGALGPDTMKYSFRDPEGNASGWADVTFVTSSQPGNRAPTPHKDNYSAVSGIPLAVGDATGLLKNDGDFDNDSFVVQSVLLPDHGTLSMSATKLGGFTYQSNPGFTGTDQFRYRTQDSQGNISNQLATVTLTVQAAPPVVTELKITRAAGGIVGTPGSVVAQIVSANSFKSGTKIEAYVEGVPGPI